MNTTRLTWFSAWMFSALVWGSVGWMGMMMH